MTVGALRPLRNLWDSNVFMMGDARSCRGPCETLEPHSALQKGFPLD